MAQQHDADPVDPAASEPSAVDPAASAPDAAADSPSPARAVARRVRAAWCFLVSGLG